MNRIEVAKQIKFLENLLQKLKDETLSEEEHKRLSEYVIQESYISNKKDQKDQNDEKEQNDQKEQKDQLKYFALGWYIYENYLFPLK